MFLLDPRDGHAKALHGTPTAAVRWLAFDAAARTLVVRAENGVVAAWDVASGLPRVDPMPGSNGENGAVHVDGDTLWVVRGDAVGGYTLPPRAGYDDVMVAAPARLRSRRAFMPNALDVHSPSRLLALGGTDGQVGLWRLPASPIRGTRAARLPARRLHFDGDTVLAVDAHEVQLRGALDDAPRSAGVVFADPVRLAERSGDGSRIAVVAGRTVHVLDAAAGHLVGAPVVLPESPLRAEMSAAAPVMVLTTGEQGPRGFVERLHVVDLDRGGRRAFESTTSGPLSTLLVDPTGRRLLVGAWDLETRDARTTLLALDGTAGCPAPVPADVDLVLDAVFSPGGDSLWLVAALPERRGALLRIDVVRCVETLRVPLQQGNTTPRMAALGDGVLVHRQSGNLLSRFDASGARRDVTGMVGAEPLGTFAIDAEGRRVAIAARNAVQLVDLDSGEPLSGLLAAPISGDDAIIQVALSPRADVVVARSLRGHWLAWPLAGTTLPVEELALRAGVLDPRNADPRLDDAMLAALRQRLRADDGASQPPSGPPPAEPLPELVVDAAPGSAPDPRFVPLDLSPAVNAPLHGGWPRRGAMDGDTPTLPSGPHRFAGVDWQVDGGVQLSWGGAAASLHPTRRASAVVPVPAVAARRVHLLMLIHVPVDPRQGRSRAATVALLDHAGRRTELEVQMTRDVVTHSLPQLADPTARIGWIGISGQQLRGGASAVEASMVAYAVSLDVPAGTPPVHGLVLETRDGPMEAPLFYAVTLERGVAERTVP